MVSLSRRRFVASIANFSATAGACLAFDKAGTYPSEIKRYADEATEFNVFRLTDPAHQSWLPALYSRAISKKTEFLLHSSERSGSVQAYRLDLKSGQSRVLT